MNWNETVSEKATSQRHVSLSIDWFANHCIQSIRLHFPSAINSYIFLVQSVNPVRSSSTGSSLSRGKQERARSRPRLDGQRDFSSSFIFRVALALALVGVSATAEYQLTRSVCVDKRGSVRVTENPSSSGPSRPDRPRSPLKYTAVWPVPVTGYNEARWGLSVVAWRAIDNLSSPNYTRPRRAAHRARDTLSHTYIHISVRE